ncbi:MAG: LamG domain-containing protein [Labilithrix sp.]|nr:LamG domain-containing protein [Labilithrix sp.]
MSGGRHRCLALAGALALSCGDPTAPAQAPPVPAADAEPPQPRASCAIGGVKSGLRVYYAFDEGEGASVNDCSGNAIHGQIVSPARSTWVEGHTGGALLLHGEDSCVDVGSSILADTYSSFTATAWVHVHSLSSAANARLVGRSHDVTVEGWELSFRPDGKVAFLLSRESGGPLVVEVAAPIGRWAHVAAVFRPGEEAVLWIDGARVASAPATFSSFVHDPTAHLRIGCRKETVDDALHGAVDEVRIYARALAAYEIAELAL